MVRQRVAPARRVETVAREVWHVAAPVVRSNVALGALLAALTWPGTPALLAPIPGLDPSWQAALVMAAQRHLHFGTDVIWTYGPLGFLMTRRLYETVPAALALLFHYGTATATFAVLVAALRRRTSLAVAIVVAYVAGYPMVAVWGNEEVVLALALVLAVRLLSRPAEAATTRAWWIAFGAGAGLMALEKLSLGLGIMALVAIALVCSTARLLAFTLAAGSFLAVAAAGWFGTGNGFGNVVAYLRATRETAAGYTAMALGPWFGFYVGVAILGGLAMVGGAAVYARSLRNTGPSAISRRAAIGIAIANALVVWILFKEGFVRADEHRVVFFAAMPIIVAGLVIGPATTTTQTGRDRGFGIVIAFLLSALIAFAVFDPPTPNFVRPLASARGFYGSVETLVLPGRRHDVVRDARARLRRAYAIPPAMLERIGTGTVDIDPIEHTVAWTYPELRWKPLPTLQTYFAYTPALDDRDVAVIDSRDAPQFILRQQPSAIDGRWPSFEPPSTRIAMECTYRQVAVSVLWQLLEHAANRCGSPRELGHERVAFDHPVTVPTARSDEMVVARFDLHLPWWWALAETAYKPPQVMIRLNGSPIPSRFVVGTAGEPHLLVAASTSSFSAPYGAPPIRQLRLESGGAGSSATITFSAIRVR